MPNWKKHIRMELQLQNNLTCMLLGIEICKDSGLQKYRPLELLEGNYDVIMVTKMYPSRPHGEYWDMHSRLRGPPIDSHHCMTMATTILFNMETHATILLLVLDMYHGYIKIGRSVRVTNFLRLFISILASSTINALGCQSARNVRMWSLRACINGWRLPCLQIGCYDVRDGNSIVPIIKHDERVQREL